MADNKTLQNIIYELTNKLSNVLYTRNLEFSVVRLIFLKYCVDNYIGATKIEDMQLCAKAQKMFAMRDVEGGLHIIAEVLDYIDYAYGLNKILSGYDTIDEYARELFGEYNSSRRKNTDVSSFKSVMDILSSLDLEEKKESQDMGQSLVKMLFNNIINGSYRNSYAGEISTKLSLCKLAEKLLDVKTDEVFCDFTSGIGLSTFLITEKTFPRIVNVEINNSTIAIAAMLYIMYGYKNFKLHCADSLSAALPDIYGDKVFADAPMGMLMRKTYENEYSDGSLASIHRVIHNYLSDKSNATAVLTMPPSPLFQTKKQAVLLRKELIDKRMLKAVIALPPMWRGSNIGTNLLVISRQCNDEVIFINAAEESIATKDKLDITGAALLPDNKIELIVDTINNKTTIENFSNVVTTDKIADMGFNLIPVNYIKKREKKENITIAEIDAQLAKLYRQLTDLSQLT